MHNVLNDINNDSERLFEKSDNGYIITVKPNYSNSKELVSEKVYIDNDLNIVSVEVIDSNGNVKMKMYFNDISYNSDFDSDYFNLNSNLSVFSESDVLKNNIDNVLYPMYIPQNTFLSSQDKVSLDDGERIIMTFSGDYPFMIIQETLGNVNDSLLSVSGNPYQLIDCIGVLDESSVSWISNGISYYMVSNSLNQEQLVEIANSMSVASIVK